VISISRRNLRFNRSGNVAVRISCPRSAKSFCRGTVRLRFGKQTIAARRFALDPGERSTVRLSRTKSGVQVLRTRTRLRVTIQAVARDADRRGATTTRRVTAVRPR
jgi:hypothetical protein